MITSISENNGIALLDENDVRIYSVGISTGGVAEMRMAQANLQRCIIATTIDLEGAQFARQLIEQAGLSNQIDVRIEDVANDLPYPDACFDFIYARLVLHYLPQLKLIAALRELHRVLKTDGKIFVVVRSVECQQAQDKNATFDPITKMTTFSSRGTSYARYFHSEESIQNYLHSSGFHPKYVKSYEEQLCVDFKRLQPSGQVDMLIESLACKKWIG